MTCCSCTPTASRHFWSNEVAQRHKIINSTLSFSNLYRYTLLFRSVYLIAKVRIMEGGMNCIKYSMFFFNLLTFVSTFYIDISTFDSPGDLKPGPMLYKTCLGISNNYWFATSAWHKTRARPIIIGSPIIRSRYFTTKEHHSMVVAGLRRPLHVSIFFESVPVKSHHRLPVGLLSGEKIMVGPTRQPCGSFASWSSRHLGGGADENKPWCHNFCLDHP